MNQTTKIVAKFYRVAHSHTMEENAIGEYHPTKVTVYETYKSVVVF